MYRQLCFYTSRTNNLIEKKNQENDLWLYPKNKILKNKFNGDKDLHAENYKTLLKENKEDPDK